MQKLKKALSVLAFILAASLAIPAHAESGAEPQSPGATTPEKAKPEKAKPEKAKMARKSPAERVEARILDLQQSLKITAEQTDAWNKVAQVMRDNSAAIDALVKEKRNSEKAMTAIDDLRSYQQIAETHASNAKKMADTFETFYASLPDEQKKIADQVFRADKRHTRGEGKHSEGKKK